MVNENYLSDAIIETIETIQLQEINDLVWKTYNLNLANYTPSILKNRLALALFALKVTDIKEFIIRLKEKNFFEKVINLILVETKEFYRDPTTWTEIKELIINKIHPESLFKIWFPSCASGEELYSLTMMLKKAHLLEKVTIFASNTSGEMISNIKSGLYDKQNNELDLLNFKRTDMLDAYTEFFKPIGDKCLINSNLIDNVTFLLGDILATSEMVPDVNLIILRNDMLYYTAYYKNIVLSTIAKKILPEGYLIIGIKESLAKNHSYLQLKCINEAESIYYKKRG